MALDYYVELEHTPGEIVVDDLACALMETFGLSRFPSTGIMRAAHVGVSVFESRDRIACPDPAVTVAFRLDKFAPEDAAADEMLAMLRWLLAHLSVALRFTDDDALTLLWRDHGVTVVARDQEFWTPRRLAALSVSDPGA